MSNKNSGKTEHGSVGTADIRKTQTMRCFGNKGGLSVRVRAMKLETKLTVRVSISLSRESQIRGHV